VYERRTKVEASLAETLALAQAIGNEKRRARAADARELRRRVANGTASVDEMRRAFPQRFAHR
jgi:hypothetical protein